MLSNPQNITATKSTSSSVAKATNEYLNDESLEDGLNKFEENIANKLEDNSYAEYLQSETTKTHFTGEYAKKYKLENKEMTLKHTKDFIEGKSLDGKQQVRHKKNKEGKVVYNYNLDIVYSSNKYLNTSLAVGDNKMKNIMQKVHNTGTKIAIAELEKLAVVKIKGKYQKALIPIAKVQHHKSRANEENNHNHIWLNLFGECKDGTHRVVDEKPFKNATNRLYIDMIAKNAEMNALIEEGVKVSPMKEEISSITDNLDRSFYSIDGVEKETNLFNTEEKLILKEYNKLIKSHTKEIAPLIIKAKNLTITKEESKRLEKLNFEINKNNASLIKNNIAKNVRAEKTELSIEEIRKNQTDKVLKSNPNFNQSFLHENPEAQKKLFKLNEPLSELEITSILDKVLDKKVRTSELEIKAYIVDAFKGRFSTEALDKQYLSISEKYLIYPKNIEGMNQYTTKEKLVSEMHFKKVIEKLSIPTNEPILNEKDAAKTIADINASRKANNQPELNAKQQEAVLKGLSSKSNAFMISAFAGTGKTTATLKPIVDNYIKATNGNVYTATVANLPANILKNEVNANQAYNTTTLITDLKSGKVKLTEKDLIILDEASMIGLKDNLTISEYVLKAKAKIIYVGDYEQLHSITSQSSMRIILDTLDNKNIGNLSQVVRQKDKEQANTVELISKGNIQEALKSIYKNKQADFFNTPQEAKTVLTEDYINLVKNKPNEKTTVYAYRIDDIITMNELIADKLKTEKIIGNVALNTEYQTTKDDFGSSKKHSIELYEKENIIFKETYYDKDNRKIANGQQGQIVSINGKTLTIKLEGEDNTIDVDTNKYKKLLPNMCMSLYASQGATTGNSLTLADESYNRKLPLIGLSRGALMNKIYVNGDKETLETILNKTVEKENLFDTATPEEKKHFEAIYNNALKNTSKTDFKSILNAIDINAINGNISESYLDKVKKTAIELKDKVVAVDYVSAVKETFENIKTVANGFNEQLKEDIQTVKQFKNNVADKLDKAKEISLTPIYKLDTMVGNNKIIKAIKENNVDDLTFEQTFANPEIVKIIEKDTNYKDFNFFKMTTKELDLNKNLLDVNPQALIILVDYARRKQDTNYIDSLDEPTQRTIKYIGEYNSLSPTNKLSHPINRFSNDITKINDFVKKEIHQENEVIKAKENAIKEARLKKEDLINRTVEILTNGTVEDISVIKKELQKSSMYINNVIDDNKNRLGLALYNGVASNNLEKVKLLVENGLNTNYNNPNKKNIISMACENKNEDIAKYLIQNGARIPKDIQSSLKEPTPAFKEYISTQLNNQNILEKQQTAKQTPTIRKGPSLGLSM
jgi:hypothetical protein